MPVVERPCPVERLTDGPAEHFFGYYDKTPWSPDGERLLALRVAAGGEAAVVVLEDGRRRELGRTTAWTWQQGAMAQWLGPEGREAVYNSASGAVVVDAASGLARTLPRPVYAVAADGRTAYTVDFGRFARTHPTLGYAGAPETGEALAALDLATGAIEPLLSFAELAELAPHPSMDGAVHWVSHVVAGERLAFLHRWSRDPVDEDAWWHRLVVLGPGGPGALETTDGMISHPVWLDGERLLAWSSRDGRQGFHLYGAAGAEPFGAGLLAENGHCTPRGDWVVTDTYPDADGVQTLSLYHAETETRVIVGRFAAAPRLGYHDRCDLHPRWSPDGTRICIDSAHEGPRQMFAVDVADVVGGKGDT